MSDLVEFESKVIASLTNFVHTTTEDRLYFTVPEILRDLMGVGSWELVGHLSTSKTLFLIRKEQGTRNIGEYGRIWIHNRSAYGFEDGLFPSRVTWKVFDPDIVQLEIS